jgi:hypothetical protein
MVVLKTSGAQEIDGDVYPFVRGQVFFLGAFQAHTILQSEGLTCDYYNITFQPELVYGSDSDSGAGNRSGPACWRRSTTPTASIRSN